MIICRGNLSPSISFLVSYQKITPSPSVQTESPESTENAEAAAKEITLPEPKGATGYKAKKKQKKIGVGVARVPQFCSADIESLSC